METKNIIIQNYVSAINTLVASLTSTLASLTTNDENINGALIRTADINITAINSQIIILQSALDDYGG